MIHNARGTLEHYAELVGGGCTPMLDHNPFGAVRAGGYCRLKGWVIMSTVAPAPARFRDDYQVDDLLLSDCVGTKFLFRPDARVEVRAMAKRPGIENPWASLARCKVSSLSPSASASSSPSTPTAHEGPSGVTILQFLLTVDKKRTEAYFLILGGPFPPEYSYQRIGLRVMDLSADKGLANREVLEDFKKQALPCVLRIE
jgi:hypothetical protein